MVRRKAEGKATRVAEGGNLWLIKFIELFLEDPLKALLSCISIIIPIILTFMLDAQYDQNHAIGKLEQAMIGHSETAQERFAVIERYANSLEHRTEQYFAKLEKQNKSMDSRLRNAEDDIYANQFLLDTIRDELSEIGKKVQ